MDWKLELVPLPVADVDRAKTFYTDKVGFKLDHDVRHGEMRVVQLTPPGSACSIVFGQGIVKTPPGSVQGLHVVVSDLNAARAQLLERGVEVSEVKDSAGESRLSSSKTQTATAGRCSTSLEEPAGPRRRCNRVSRTRAVRQR